MSEAAITALLEPVVAQHALEVDSIELLKAGSRTLLRVFLDGDGANGRGPNLDEIAAATKAISYELDESPVMGDAPYVLEVSSRGVTKPLVKPAHFRRNIGHLVTFTLVSGEQFTARITDAADDSDAITVLFEDAPRTVVLADVTNALVQVELNRPKAGPADEDEGEAEDVVEDEGADDELIDEPDEEEKGE
jgi:ribosome maturation factor RimP